MPLYAQFNRQNNSFLVTDSDSENRAIERVTLDNEQETEKVIRILQALNITLVDGHLPMSVKNTVNFILLKEQAEEVRRILIQDLEADRIVERKDLFLKNKQESIPQ